MIEVIDIEHYNLETAQIETLHVCSSSDFIANGVAYMPILSQMFDFDESLFDRGTTEGQLTVGLGTIVINNPDGKLDYLRTHGFDGRAIRIYRPKDKDDRVTDSSNLYFTGTIAYAQRGWTQTTLYIKSRMEALNVPMQPNGFAGTNLGTGGDGGYEGSADLAGATKPQIFGRCSSVPGAIVNEFFLTYAFNFDRNGDPLPVYRIYNVYVKGIRYIYNNTDYADPAALQAGTIATGFFATCLAYGMLRLGSAPASNGRLVADIADAPDEQCTAAQVAERILQQNAGMVPQIDYDAGQLAALDTWDITPVGIYIADNTTIADATNQILDSIGAWYIPNQKGVFHFGYIDLPDNMVQAGFPVAATITKDQWEDSIDTVPVDDQSQNIPAYSVEIKHTKNWSVQDSGALADAVSPAAREFFTKQWRSVRKNSAGTLIAHPLAPSLSYETLLQSQLYLPLLNEDFSTSIAVGGNGWNLTGAGAIAVQASGGITITPHGGNIAQLEQPLAYEDTFQSGTLEVGFTLLAGKTVLFTIVRGIANTVVYSETVASSAADQYIVRTISVAAGQLTSAWNAKWRFTTVDAVTDFTVKNVFVRYPQVGIGPDGQALRRLQKQISFQERYSTVIPYNFFIDNNLMIGSIVKLQDDDRFGMENGLNFLIIGVNRDDDNYKIDLDVWRGMIWPLPVTL